MAHHTLNSSYTSLVNRLNLFPQGAPPSKLLDKILTMLFSEKEAHFVSLLPIKPFTAAKAARIWKMSLPEAQRILDKLASRAILVDIDLNGETEYVLPPPMAGFFEFSMMRVRSDVDQKVLGELVYEYLNVEEDFIKDLFTLGETQLGRVFVHEPVLSNKNAIHVLDYERASEVIKTASHMGVSTCYCRHKMLHVNRACDNPLDICMTFNTTGACLIKHGFARQVDVMEGLDLLDQAYESNLVQFGENVRNRVNFICNCCGCCCEALIAARRFAIFNPVHTSNFFPVIDEQSCTGCGKCVNICPVEAMTLVSANDPKKPKRKAAGIVKQLLHFSRKTDQTLKPIGAVTVIKDSLKFLRSTIPSNIEIKTQLPDAEIPILADPIQINQIMMNLCINASHAMEETGGIMEINMETASLNKETVNSYPDLTIANCYLKITLSDTGSGIPSKTINRIFDPYFTTKEFCEGSGMGLTVVQGIIKNHDGAITVNSQVGKGTTFTILFPVIDEAPEITTKQTGEIPHGTETILFVDDEEVITNMMQQILERLGYRVEAKLNPKEALDLFQSKPDSFDIVITDMTMPQMTGAKFAEKLKEIRSDIPIILSTGHSSLIDEDKAKQSGISGYVMKPVSMRKIAKAIREALDQ